MGGVREDGLEAMHAIGNALRRRLACVRADEERLKGMLQLGEAQQQLKSADFSKPTTSRVRKAAASQDAATATTSAVTVEAGTSTNPATTMEAGTAMDAVVTSDAAITATATTVDMATTMASAVGDTMAAGE